MGNPSNGTGVVLNEVVLYASDVERSKTFYTALGLDFAPVVQETSNGPMVSYEAVLGGPVGFFLQLFPAGVRPPTRTRFRFEVDDLAPVVARLRELSIDHTLDEVANIMRGTDPDGTKVYIVAKRYRTRRDTPSTMWHDRGPQT